MWYKNQMTYYFFFCLQGEKKELLDICEKQVKALPGQTVRDCVIIHYLNTQIGLIFPFWKAHYFFRMESLME